MPHQCIECETTYEDGTDTVLTGCSECGGTTFQYLPQSKVTDESDGEVWFGGGVVTGEDPSQHDARTAVVDDSEIPDAEEVARQQQTSQTSDEAEASAQVDISALQQELNRQFEGIKILSPGQYEINLTRLFEREECVISLQEDGRYVINILGQNSKNDIGSDI